MDILHPEEHHYTFVENVEILHISMELSIQNEKSCAMCAVG